MRLAIPAVKISDYAHAAGIGGPNGKSHALHAFNFNKMCAKKPVALVIMPFVEQINRLFVQGRRFKRNFTASFANRCILI